MRAFGCGKSNKSSACGHRWQVHLQVMWEPEPREKIKVKKEANITVSPIQNLSRSANDLC